MKKDTTDARRKRRRVPLAHHDPAAFDRAVDRERFTTGFDAERFAWKAVRLG